MWTSWLWLWTMLCRVETGIMATLWDTVLQRFQMTSVYLQYSSNQDLKTQLVLSLNHSMDIFKLWGLSLQILSKKPRIWLWRSIIYNKFEENTNERSERRICGVENWSSAVQHPQPLGITLVTSSAYIGSLNLPSGCVNSFSWVLVWGPCDDEVEKLPFQATF